MGDRPALSKGEMEVIRVVWEHGSASVRQVHEALAARKDVDFATVQTYLRRLEAKGYLKGENKGKTRIYAPRAKPKAVVRDTVNEFLDRMFGGAALPLVRHLVEDGNVTPAEIAELRALLARLDADRREAGRE